MRLLVVVPSRSRPSNAHRLLDAFHATAACREDVGLLFSIDTTDPTAEEYPAAVRADNGSMVEALNLAAVAAAGDVEYLGFMGDDHLPVTPGWDAAILAALDALPGPGVVYANDLFQGPNLPTAVFMHASIVRALGWMAPPCLVHLYVDNAWRDLGERLGAIRYLPDVVIEHLHPHAGKAEGDDQYALVNSEERSEADRLAWLDWREHSLPACVEAIRQEVTA